MKILTMGAASLLERSEPVLKIDGALRRQIASMYELMDSHNGVGLAAPQVGINRRFFILRLKEGEKTTLTCINPVILSETSRRTTSEEGCLSVPGLYGPVERASGVTVRYLDENGGEHTLKAKDFLARVIQHEYDHLEGRLFLHRMAPEALEVLKQEVAQIGKTGKKPK